MSDVVIWTPAEDEDEAFTPLERTSLGGLADVNTTGAEDGQVLGYDDDTETWGPVEQTGGGGASGVDDLTGATMVEVPSAAVTPVTVNGGRITRHVYVTQPRTDPGDRAPFLKLPPAADHEGESVVILCADDAASATVCEVDDTPTPGVLDWSDFYDFTFAGSLQPSGDFTVTWNLDGEEVVSEVDVSTLVSLQAVWDAFFGPLVAEGAVLDLNAKTVTSGTTGVASVVEHVSDAYDVGGGSVSGMAATLGDSTQGYAGTIRGVDGYGGVLGASLWYPNHQVISETGTHNHNDAAVAIQRGARVWAVPAALNDGTAKWSAEVWPVRDDQIIYRPDDGVQTVHAALDDLRTRMTAAEAGGGGLDESEVQALIDDAVTALLDGAPGALDTLNELAAAVNDDASFAASVTTALAGKVPTSRQVAGQALSADITAAALRTALSLYSPVVKPSDTARTDAVGPIVPAADPHLTKSVAAGTYVVTARLPVTGGNNTPDIQVALTGGTVTFDVFGVAAGATAGGTAMVHNGHSTGTHVNAGTGSYGTYIVVQGVCTLASSGTIAVSWAQANVSAQPTTVLAGAVLQVEAA